MPRQPVQAVAFPDLDAVSARFELATIAELKAFPAQKLASGNAVLVLGYHAPGDGGGGLFHWDGADETADNSGTIIAPDAGKGRWLRVYDGGLNVRWFGAVGDGISDDSAAFRAAISARVEVVMVPAGDYLLGSVVNLESDLRIVADCGANVIPGAGCDSFCLKATGKANIRMGGLNVKFVAGVTPQVVLDQGTFGSCTGVHFENCLGCSVAGLRSSGLFGSLNFYNSSECRADGCEFESCNAGLAVVADADYAGPALCRGVFVTGCRILDCADDGIAFLTRNGGAVHNCSAVGNYITKTGRLTTHSAACGIRVGKFSTGTISAVNISDNQFAEMIDEAIRVSGASDSIVHGNTCKGYAKRAGGVGAFWFSALTRTSITNNAAMGQVVNSVAFCFSGVAKCRIAQNSASTAVNGNACARFDTACDSNVVSENVFHNTAAYGMLFSDDCTRNLVARNDVSVYVAFGILSGTGATNVFKDNAGYVTRNSGVNPIPAAATSNTFNHGLSNPRVAKIRVSLTPKSDILSAGGFWVSAVTSTQITIRSKAAPGADNVDVAWEAVEE